MYKCIEVLPDEPGWYCVVINGVLTMYAIHMEFDGVEWIWRGLNLHVYGKSKSGVYWYG